MQEYLKYENYDNLIRELYTKWIWLLYKYFLINYPL